MNLVDRRNPRFEFDHFPWVFALSLTEPAGEELPMRVEARNISRGGLKFVSNRKISLFEQVQVVLFEKKTGKEVVTLLGKVVRVEEVDIGTGERTYGIAVEFNSGMTVLEKLIPDRAIEAKGDGI